MHLKNNNNNKEGSKKLFYHFQMMSLIQLGGEKKKKKTTILQVWIDKIGMWNQHATRPHLPKLLPATYSILSLYHHQIIHYLKYLSL